VKLSAYPEKVMSHRRRLAVSYSRFSCPLQAKGDSMERQEVMFREFCQRHNLTPLAEIFADRGKSGYKDEHRKKGRLGQLVAAAKDGRFEPETVVVVEAWDRLGRLRPDKQTELVAELLRTGVHIGVCRLNEIFTEDDFGTHKWTTLAVFIQLAFQESKQKAERVAASWQRRRERARAKGNLLTTRLPAWLECDNGEVRLIPERAAVVKRVFRLSAEGLGERRIVETLTHEKVPPFGKHVVREGRGRSQFCGNWTCPYVALILRDRRAIGELQPRKINDTPDGPPLVGYYPAAVTEREYLLARAGQDSRRTKARGKAASESRYVNVFKGLLKHARDGEGFLLHNKGTAKEPELILINATGNSGRDRSYTFPYFVFEEKVLEFLREVDPRDVLPREQETASKVDVLRTKLAAVRQDLLGLQEDLKAGYSKALAAVLREQEAQEQQIGLELQEELARSVKPAERAWRELPSLAKLVRDGGDEARLKLRPVLRRVIEDAYVLIVRRRSFQLCVVQFFFTGGGRRDYFLVYQPAAYRRPGGVWVRSIADVGKAGDLDLHRRDHAARLEKALAACTPLA
jgi:DNA invertase Pin-like site-specific DNA recombinase